MNRVVKLTVIGAAIAGAAVGTVAFLRSRGSHSPEMVDYDELADAAGDALESGKDAASSTFDAAKDAVADAAEA